MGWYQKTIYLKLFVIFMTQGQINWFDQKKELKGELLILENLDKS
jgi:hypothetical protein